MTPLGLGRQRLCHNSLDLGLGSRTSYLSPDYVIIVTNACEKADTSLPGRATSVGMGKGVNRDLTRQSCH